MKLRKSVSPLKDLLSEYKHSSQFVMSIRHSYANCKGNFAWFRLDLWYKLPRSKRDLVIKASGVESLKDCQVCDLTQLLNEAMTVLDIAKMVAWSEHYEM